jgi:hypothetical protein
MEYNRIIAITGLGGLFELLTSKSDGAIVRSLEDQQTRFVSSRVHNFSHLESIEVYTTRENINLVDLFKAIQTSGQALPSDKDAAAVKAFFVKVYPDLDFERIYNSDMKKMVKWYALLSGNQVEFKLSAEAEPAGEEIAEAAASETKEAPAEPKAKAPAVAEEAPAPKKAAKAAPAEKAAAAEEPPKKKAAAAKAAPAEKEAPKSSTKGSAAPASKAAAKADDKKTDDKKADDKKKAAPKKK